VTAEVAANICNNFFTIAATRQEKPEAIADKNIRLKDRPNQCIDSLKTPAAMKSPNR
jgi:hypothetical protein